MKTGGLPSSTRALLQRSGQVCILTGSSLREPFAKYFHEIAEAFSDPDMEKQPSADSSVDAKAPVLAVRIQVHDHDTARDAPFINTRFFQGPDSRSKQAGLSHSDKEHQILRILKRHSDALWSAHVSIGPSPDAETLRTLLYNLNVARDFFSMIVVWLDSDFDQAAHDLSTSATIESALIEQSTYTLVVESAKDSSEVESLVQTIQRAKTTSDTASMLSWWHLTGLHQDHKPNAETLKPLKPQIQKLCKPDRELACFPPPLQRASELPRLFRDQRDYLAELKASALLVKNPPLLPRQMLLLFRWPLGVLLLLIFAVAPIKILQDTRKIATNEADKIRLQQKEELVVEFDGKTTLQRGAKRAIHHFLAMVPSKGQVDIYVQETLKKNGRMGQRLKKEFSADEAIYPPNFAKIWFYRPETLRNPEFDSLAPAYHYFSNLVVDSLAYVTDHYNDTPGEGERVHYGLDLAARVGSFILAPFAGKVYTAESKWGGKMIAVSDGSHLVFFAHCDQLFALNGQEVVPGDPIATIGMTGRTTGPHAHIGAGYVRPDGNHSFGPLRFEFIDPIVWYNAGANAYKTGYERKLPGVSAYQQGKPEFQVPQRPQKPEATIITDTTEWPDD